MNEVLVIVLDEQSVENLRELKEAIARVTRVEKRVVYAGDREWEAMVQDELGVTTDAWTTIAASSDSLRPLWWWAWSLMALWSPSAIANSSLVVWDGRWVEWRFGGPTTPPVLRAWWAVCNARTPWDAIEALEQWRTTLTVATSPDAARDILNQLTKWIGSYVEYSDAIHARPNSYDWDHATGLANSARAHGGLDLGTKKSAFAKQAGSLQKLSGLEFPVPWSSVDRLAEPCDPRRRPIWPNRLRHWSALLFVRAESMARAELRAESVLMVLRALESYLYALALENGIVCRSARGEWQWDGAVSNSGLPSLEAIYSHLASIFAPLARAEDDVKELRWLRNRSICGHGWGGADTPAVERALRLVHDLLVALDGSGVWRATLSDLRVAQPARIAAVFGASIKASLASP